MSASHPSEAATRVTVGDHTFFPDNAARDLEAMAYEYETSLKFKLDSTSAGLFLRNVAHGLRMCARTLDRAARSPAPSDDADSWMPRDWTESDNQQARELSRADRGELYFINRLARAFIHMQRRVVASFETRAAPSVEARDADDLLNRFHSVCDGLREYAESGYPKNAQARYDAVRAELRALLPPEKVE